MMETDISSDLGMATGNDFEDADEDGESSKSHCCSEATVSLISDHGGLDEVSDPEEKGQSQKLWGAESCMRCRVYLTTIEKHDLEHHLQTQFTKGQVELALACFGKPEGRACTKLLWEHTVKKVGWEKGEACSSILYDFSLAKSLLLSSRAVQDKDIENACFCFPRTSIMPAGCFHKAVAVGQSPQSSKTKAWHCSQCSVCLRCSKSFGLDISGLVLFVPISQGFRFIFSLYL